MYTRLATTLTPQSQAGAFPVLELRRIELYDPFEQLLLILLLIHTAI